MAERLRNGVPLTELVVPQGLLPRSAAMQIHAGVVSSSLESSLRDTAIRVTHELTYDDESANAGGALVYPAAMIPIACLIVGFLMYYIIPKFKKIFDDFGTELPQPTIVLIQLSDAVINFWYVFGLPLFYIPVIIFIFVSMAQYYGWRVMLQSVLGGWFIRWHTPDVMRALSQSVAQKIPLDQALNSIAKHPGPIRLRDRLAWAVESLQAGTPSWQTLQAAGLLKHSEALVLETAEQSGNLTWALETLATNMERRSAFRVSAIMEVVRPILLIGMSLIVGFIAFAMFLPLVKLLNDLS
jgi:type IV pilus assembly protein PilC